MEEVGYVYRSSLSEVEITAFTPVEAASYLYVEFDRPTKGRVLLFVSSVSCEDEICRALRARDLKATVERERAQPELVEEPDFCVKAVPVLDLHTKGRPRTPIPPKSPVYKPSKEILEEAFSVSYSSIGDLYARSPEASWIRLGVLRSKHDVEVRVNVDAVLSKHLAILGSTGSGKSNTVAVLIDRVVSIGGQVLVVDSHGEYVNLELAQGEVLPVQAKINPLQIAPSMLADILIAEPAPEQRRLLRRAIREVNKLYNDFLRGGMQAARSEGMIKAFIEQAEGEIQVEDCDYLKTLYGYLLREMMTQNNKREQERYEKVLSKLEDDMVEFGDIISLEASDPTALLHPGRAVILDVSEMPQKGRDEVVSHVAYQLLRRAARREILPTLLIVEEAHLYLATNLNTRAKRSLEKIAREGRKYGVGLVIVSQRPRGIDPNVLSQVNSICVLRIRQPEDQRHIKESSEWFTEDMYSALPTLETGESVLLGEWVKMPVAVKIDKHEGKKRGVTFSATAAWLKALEEKQKPIDVESQIMEEAERLFS
ncbi:MAG: ATP-binding protein [Candidatus Verstraetearchaeota archaeon]|nr:ATP-binding protein [Candidatus Verstraetearchaeota archaeon]